MRSDSHLALFVAIVVIALFPARSGATIAQGPCSLNSSGTLAELMMSCDAMFVGTIESTGGPYGDAAVKLGSSWAGVSDEVPDIRVGIIVSAQSFAWRDAAIGEQVAVCLAKVRGKWREKSVLRTGARPHPSCDLEVYRRWTLGIRKARSAKTPKELAYAWLEILPAAEVAGEVNRGLSQTGYYGTLLPDGEILVPPLLEAVKSGRMMAESFGNVMLSWPNRMAKMQREHRAWLELLEVERESVWCVAFKVLSLEEDSNSNAFREACPSAEVLEAARKHWRQRVADEAKALE